MKILIKEITQNQPITTFFYLGSYEIKETTRGRSFLLLRLSDKTGRLFGFIWNKPRLVLSSLKEKSFVKVRGVTKLLKGSLVIDIERIRMAEAGEIEMGDFYQIVPGGIAFWFEQLVETLGLIEDSHCRRLINAFLNDKEFMNSFKRCPGGLSYHHSYLGGLLEHTVTTMRQAAITAERFPETLQRDLLLTGCFLHDIGKTRELSEGLVYEYTTEGRLLGHISLGLLMLEEKILQVEGFPENLSMPLRHMILSHHGRLEFGSPVKPLTPEAIALHLIEGTDATLNHIDSFVKGADPNRPWSFYDRFFKAELFLKGYARKIRPSREEIPRHNGRGNPLGNLKWN